MITGSQHLLSWIYQNFGAEKEDYTAVSKVGPQHWSIRSTIHCGYFQVENNFLQNFPQQLRTILRWRTHKHTFWEKTRTHTLKQTGRTIITRIYLLRYVLGTGESVEWVLQERCCSERASESGCTVRLPPSLAAGATAANPLGDSSAARDSPSSPYVSRPFCLPPTLQSGRHFNLQPGPVTSGRLWKTDQQPTGLTQTNKQKTDWLLAADSTYCSGRRGGKIPKKNKHLPSLRVAIDLVLGGSGTGGNTILEKLQCWLTRKDF